MTRDELTNLPPTLDVPTAAKILGIGRSLAYDLIRQSQWPTPVVRVGKLIKIPTAPLLRLLDDPSPGGQGYPQSAWLPPAGALHAVGTNGLQAS